MPFPTTALPLFVAALIVFTAWAPNSNAAAAGRASVLAITEDTEPRNERAADPAELSIRPAGTLARPQDGVQHPDLDYAWMAYDSAVKRVTEEIRAAISKQFDASTDKGDLDGAEKWEQALEKFEKEGAIPDDRALKTTVVGAVADYRKAKDELTKSYEAVVKAFTIERKIAEAKAVRSEASLLNGEATAVAVAHATTNEGPRGTHRGGPSRPQRPSETTKTEAPGERGVARSAKSSPVAYRFVDEKEVKKSWDVKGDWRLQHDGIRFTDGGGLRSLFRVAGDSTLRVAYAGGMYQRLRVQAWGQSFVATGPFVVARKGNEVAFAENGGAPTVVKLKEEEIARLLDTGLEIRCDSNSSTPSHVIESVVVDGAVSYNTGAAESRRPNPVAVAAEPPRKQPARPVTGKRPVEDLRNYPFVGEQLANSTEAQDMLRWLGATDIVVEPGGGCIRGQLRPDQEVRLWPNTYGKPMCYGIRTKDPSGPPGQHEPYFEVCRAAGASR